jgi:LacI family transcriptional regulator
MFGNFESNNHSSPSKTLRISAVLPLAGHGQRILAGAVQRFGTARRLWSLRPVDPDSPLVIEELEQWAPKGVMVLNSQDKVIEWCRKNDIPYISMLGGRDSLAKHHYNACIDDLAVGKVAAEYFLHRGYRIFAFVGNGNYAFSLERQDGFESTLRASGIKVHDFIHSTPEFEERPKPRMLYHTAMAQWLKGLPKPTALFAGNDWEALAVIQACNENGIRVPDDVAVLGANDDKLVCRLCLPRISSVKLPFSRLGQEAATMLLAATRSAKSAAEPKTTLLPPISVISRNSSVEYNVSNPVVRQALDMMRAEIRRPFKIHHLLKHIGVSRPSLERYFKEELGETPLVTLRKLRLDRAKTLLADTQLNNAEIAAQTGFTSNIRFVTAFKQMVGITPGSYRENLQFEELD